MVITSTKGDVKFRCDNFYSNTNACMSMGEPDESVEFGRTHRFYRLKCLTNGISPYDGLPCRHALWSTDGKNYHWFNRERSKPRVLASKVKTIRLVRRFRLLTEEDLKNANKSL